MSKHYVSRMAVCPYYHAEHPQMIYCDGVRDGTVIHLAFASAVDAREYKTRYCRGKWHNCKIASMQEEIDHGRQND